ncbi:neurofilament light polypeptide [Pimephales promelas]|nr:neurofilament light polypeptide [Pimephales promelas]
MKLEEEMAIKEGRSGETHRATGGRDRFLKKLHDEEVADLLKQIEESKVTVELDSDRPDLAAYLRNMRAEIEAVAARNVQEARSGTRASLTL